MPGELRSARELKTNASTLSSNKNTGALLTGLGVLGILEKEVNHEEEANRGSESGWRLSFDEPVLFG